MHGRLLLVILALVASVPLPLCAQDNPPSPPRDDVRSLPGGDRDRVRPRVRTRDDPKTTPVIANAATAREFIARVEAEFAAISEYVNRAAWARATNITVDTVWLETKASAEQASLAARYAKEAAQFDNVALDAAARRKLDLIKRGGGLPPPSRTGAAAELAALATKLDSAYSTATFTFRGKPLTIDQMYEPMASLRDPAALKTLWEGWRSTLPPMRADYARLVSIANEGARELGYQDVGALWRSWYDMPQEKFAERVDALWAQVEPLYKNLHCYVRGRLNDKYGAAVQPQTGPIRADLLGHMSAVNWSDIYDIVAPASARLPYDLTKLLLERGYDVTRLVKTGENFYTSLGFTPLPESFWQRSMFTRPRDRDVVCHASAWNIDGKDDIRIKACFKIDADDFYTVHHELGHNIYQRAYKEQPLLFQDGANDGFHEAIGDFIALSALTPTYLHQIGLLDAVPGPDADIAALLRSALHNIAFLPFGMLMDKWRWDVFSGKIAPEQYNEAWWRLLRQYQGLMPPGPRPADAFDPGAHYHIPGNVPYVRYFLSQIYQFQFYRAACRQANWSGPLNRCSFYGNKDVGARFNAMLSMGGSKPWPEALAAFTGERDLDASAITDYFAPLDRWLTEQNKGESCGW
jgi:peptidyl-dipeptidase A